MRKTYVLDTSVLVHDPLSLRSFRNTHVAIPIYVVMELDELKLSRRVEVASAARLASRFIHSLRDYGSLHIGDGAFHPELKTWFRIITEDPDTSAIDIPTALRAFDSSASGHKMDGLILRSALALSQGPQAERVIVVSKDVNLRLLAEFSGLSAEDYERDRIASDELFTGFRRVDARLAGRLHQAWVPNEDLHPKSLRIDDLTPNEYIVCDDELGQHIFRYDGPTDTIRPVRRDFANRVGVEPRNVEQWIALDMLLNPEIHLITLIGKAGTGKTFLALAAALAQLQQGNQRRFQRILLSKPVVALGKDIGYLPGDMNEKLQPWMTSFHDNLDALIRTDSNAATSKGATRNERGWQQLFETRQMEIQPLHTIRGRSIANAFMLIDEAQNLTPHEIKTIITRAATGTCVVLAGDPDQVDNPFLDAHSNGLVYTAERLKGSALSGTVTFSQGQRSVLAELAATLL